KGVYARVVGHDAIYLVDSHTLDHLKRDLQDPTVFRFEADKVRALTLRGWKKSIGVVSALALERKDGKWLARDPKGFEVDQDKVNGFVSSLSRLEAERFLPSGKGKGLSLEQDALDVEITV